MKFLLIRTDKPQAELYLYEDDSLMGSRIWEAHRTLAKNLLKEIEFLLDENMTPKEELNGIGVYKGPGSFTGLRIGITIANSYAYSLEISIVSASGDEWQRECIRKLVDSENEEIALPEYGQDANITTPRK